MRKEDGINQIFVESTIYTVWIINFTNIYAELAL